MSVVEQQLLKRDRALEELKAQLLRAQAKMKSRADSKRRDVQFHTGDLVHLKSRPNRRKTFAAWENEKVAPRFYGPFAVERKIG